MTICMIQPSNAEYALQGAPYQFLHRYNFIVF